MAKDVLHALDEGSALVVQTVVLTELLDNRANLKEVVTRHGREQVVLNLKVKTSLKKSQSRKNVHKTYREPVHPHVGFNVDGGGQLQSREARGELFRVFATVVVHEDDVGNTSSSDEFLSVRTGEIWCRTGNNDEDDRSGLGRQVVVAEKENPKVVKRNAHLLILLNLDFSRVMGSDIPCSRQGFGRP